MINLGNHTNKFCVSAFDQLLNCNSCWHLFLRPFELVKCELMQLLEFSVNAFNDLFDPGLKAESNIRAFEKWILVVTKSVNRKFYPIQYFDFYQDKLLSISHNCITFCHGQKYVKIKVSLEIC